LQAPAAAPRLAATVLSGSPAKRSAKYGDQPGVLRPGRTPTSKPQFEGRKRARGTSKARRVSNHAPSEPRRGQLAPPRARTTAGASTVSGPEGDSKRSLEGADSKPVQRCRIRNRTPCSRRRWS